MRHNDAGVIRKSRRIWCRLSPNKFRSTLQENETGDSSWADGRLIARCILFIIYLPFDSQGNIVSPATLSSLLHNQLTFLLLSESVLPQLNTTESPAHQMHILLWRGLSPRSPRPISWYSSSLLISPRRVFLFLIHLPFVPFSLPSRRHIFPFKINSSFARFFLPFYSCSLFNLVL